MSQLDASALFRCVARGDMAPLTVAAKAHGASLLRLTNKGGMSLLELARRRKNREATKLLQRIHKEEKAAALARKKPRYPPLTDSLAAQPGQWVRVLAGGMYHGNLAQVVKWVPEREQFLVRLKNSLGQSRRRRFRPEKLSRASPPPHPTLRADFTRNGLTVRNGVLVKAHTSITSVVVPSSVTAIAHSAFYYCGAFGSQSTSSCANVSIAIGRAAFEQHCCSPTSAERADETCLWYWEDSRRMVWDRVSNGPSSVESLKAYAGCRPVVLPASVKGIGDRAFGSRRALRALIFVTRRYEYEMEAFLACLLRRDRDSSDRDASGDGLPLDRFVHALRAVNVRRKVYSYLPQAELTVVRNARLCPRRVGHDGTPLPYTPKW